MGELAAHRLQRAFVRLQPVTPSTPEPKASAATPSATTPTPEIAASAEPKAVTLTIRQAYDYIQAAGREADLNAIIKRRVGQPKTEENSTQYVFRKLAEGPDIRFASVDELLEVIKQRLELATAGTPNDPALRVWRKLNRLAGQLEASLVGVRRQKGESQKMVPPLEGVLNGLRKRKSSVDDHALLGDCAKALQTMIPLIEKDPRGMWFCFQAVSSFGPLGYTVLGAAPAMLEGSIKSLHEANLVTLRQIRHLMARRQGLTVIAHRGSGPTNRTMGGLIEQHDQRRLNRPAENSPEAFEAALRESTQHALLPRLDGVECDVFLSSDHIPILSHEGNVPEQLATKLWKESALNPSVHVHQLSSGELLNIKRTPSAMSRFMTLQELLTLVQPHALAFYNATGNPLRVEIEMKGTKHDKDFTRGPGSPLTVAVAKVVSQAIKRSRHVPVEYIVFNGTPTDIPMFAALRQSKTALGGLYTGIGPKEKDPSTFDPATIDELRYQFSALLPPRDQLQAKLTAGTANLAAIVDPYMSKFILTLVYGQEMAPRAHLDYATRELQGSEPSHDIDISGHTGVTKALQARARGEHDTEDLIQQLLEVYIAGGGKAEWLHILTDFPKKAQFMKQRLATTK